MASSSENYDILSLFDGSKPFKMKPFPMGSYRNEMAAQARAMAKEMSAGLNASIASSSLTSGTDYVAEYVKEEEERVLAVIIVF